MQATAYLMNPEAAESAEKRTYGLVAKAIDALVASGWEAAAQRFYPPAGLREGHPGYVLGLKVTVPRGDPRIEWRLAPGANQGLHPGFRGMRLSEADRAATQIPSGFTFSPGADGNCVLLSDVDDGTGAAIGKFIAALHAKADADLEDQFAAAASPRPRQSA